MSLLSLINEKHIKLVRKEEAEKQNAIIGGSRKIMMIEKMMKKILLHY